MFEGGGGSGEGCRPARASAGHRLQRMEAIGKPSQRRHQRLRERPAVAAGSGGQSVAAGFVLLCLALLRHTLIDKSTITTAPASTTARRTGSGSWLWAGCARALDKLWPVNSPSQKFNAWSFSGGYGVPKQRCASMLAFADLTPKDNSPTTASQCDDANFLSSATASVLVKSVWVVFAG